MFLIIYPKNHAIENWNIPTIKKRLSTCKVYGLIGLLILVGKIKFIASRIKYS